jgi:hypothetical protein
MKKLFFKILIGSMIFSFSGLHAQDQPQDDQREGRGVLDREDDEERRLDKVQPDDETQEAQDRDQYRLDIGQDREIGTEQRRGLEPTPENNPTQDRGTTPSPQQPEREPDGTASPETPQRDRRFSPEHQDPGVTPEERRREQPGDGPRDRTPGTQRPDRHTPDAPRDAQPGQPGQHGDRHPGTHGHRPGDSATP